MTENFFNKGANSTLQLPSGVNLSYQSTGLVLYDSQEVDTWYVGDFVSADYIINAEYGINERETIHATLVATPGNSNITIYARTTLARQLINVRSVSTNSKVSLVIQPASPDMSGSTISYFVNYAKSTIPIYPLNAPAIATGCYWNSTTNSAELSITATIITGNILVGQYVYGDKIPDNATVKSYDSQTKHIVIEGFAATSIKSATNMTIKFESSSTQLGDKLNSTSFKSVVVQGQPTIESSPSKEFIKITPGDGINVHTHIDDNAVAISIGDTIQHDLTISGNHNLGFTDGASLTIPSGPTLDRPSTPSSGNIRYNTELTTYEGYNGSRWHHISGLTPTLIKTSNYNALSNELVRCDSNAGGFTITLPVSPTDGDIIGILDVTGTFSTFNISVIANGKLIEGAATSFILTTAGAYVSFIYNSPTTNWRVLSQPVSNIIGGSAGQVHYQSSTDTTAYTDTGTLGQVLTSNGESAPTWTTPMGAGKAIAMAVVFGG